MRISPGRDAALVSILACVFFALPSANGAAAKVRFMDHDLSEGRTLSALPAEVRASLGGEKRIADRGGKFNSTDVIRERNAPMRRFVVAGISEDFVLVAIEHGGFAYRIEVLEFSHKDGKWTQDGIRPVAKKPGDLKELVDLLEPAETSVEKDATIYFSEAPWDGAAYSLEIPLEKSGDAPNPSIRVSIWGNPVFEKSTTIRFTGKEDPGGGPGRGDGRASYQTTKDKSWPENLSGSITFKKLKAGEPVVGNYDFSSEQGKKFKGRFKAAWGNAPARVIR